jgi:hypothetical protein
LRGCKANPGKASAGNSGRRLDRQSRRHSVPEGDRDELSVRAVSRRRPGGAGFDGRADRFDDRAGFQLHVAQVLAGTVRATRYPGQDAPSASLPDVPTTDEAGLPGFYASIWFGLWAPKDTPKDIVAKLNAATDGSVWPTDDMRSRTEQARAAGRAARGTDA